MSEQMAREVIDAAIKTSAWEEAGETASSISADRAFADAQALIQEARTVYDKRVDPEDPLPEAVIEILFAAQVEPVDGKYADIYEKKGATPPASSNGSAPESSQQSELPEDFSINSVYEGYDDQKAKDIVETIKSAAASGDLTPDELALIKLYEEANEGRKGILSLEPEFKPKEPAQTFTSTGQSSEPGDYASAEDLERAYGDGSLGSDRARQSSLPVPPAPSGEEPVLPVDITTVSDQELSRLMMRFHSLEAHALWVVSQEEGRQEACKSLRHDSHRAAFAHIFAQLKSGIDVSKSTHVENARSQANTQADSDQSVAAWRNREIRHGIEARSLKALAEGYGNAAARLSRELTRRTDLRQTPTGG